LRVSSPSGGTNRTKGTGPDEQIYLRAAATASSGGGGGETTPKNLLGRMNVSSAVAGVRGKVRQRRGSPMHAAEDGGRRRSSEGNEGDPALVSTLTTTALF
jgi:hypothetical protein